MGRRIGLFGGAFDPFHKGHLAVVKSVMNSNIVDECWIIPTFEPPHRSEPFYPYRHRKKMAELATAQIPQVFVSNIESHLQTPSYTWKTVEHITSGEPDLRLFLCLGEDSLMSFQNWMNSEKLLERCSLLVAERPGYNPVDIPENILKKTLFLEHNPIDCSSSEIRKRTLDNWPNPDDLPIAVYEYLLSYHSTPSDP